jgi:hypothetical protein
MSPAVVVNVVTHGSARLRHLGDEETGKTLCGIELMKTKLIVRPEYIPSFILCSKCDRAIASRPA